MFMRLRAIARALARAREWFPVTNLGLVVAGLAALAYWGFGVPRADFVVQVVAVLVMALTVTALLAVLVGALLVYDATDSRGEVREGAAFEAHRGWAEVFTLPMWSWLPLFDVSWTWLQPEGFHVEVVKVAGRRRERIETERRGHVDQIVRRFVIEDGFGLARVVMHRTEARPVTVLPWRGALERAPLLRSLAAGDTLAHPEGALVGDPVDMRRYVAGDPLKLAMWKVYARTRQLMVRTPERAIAPSSQVAAYLPAAEADEPAAAAARVAVESGLLGPNWTFGADGAPRSTDDAEEARRQIVAARAHRRTDAGQGAGLAAFIEQAGPADTVKLVVFGPGRPGPWMERVLAAAQRGPDDVSVVVVVDGLRAPGEDGEDRWGRWLKRPEPPSDAEEAWVTATELDEVVGTLSRARVRVTALDRVRGRVLNFGRGIRPLESTRRVA